MSVGRFAMWLWCTLALPHQGANSMFHVKRALPSWLEPLVTRPCGVGIDPLLVDGSASGAARTGAPWDDNPALWAAVTCDLVRRPVDVFDSHRQLGHEPGVHQQKRQVRFSTGAPLPRTVRVEAVPGGTEAEDILRDSRLIGGARGVAPTDQPARER